MEKTNSFGEQAGGVLISFKSVSKQFGNTDALSDVTFEARASSIHAITGENGAGKSTLMKILAGVHQVTSGEILREGKPIQFASPAAALHAGISTVFQELTLLPNLSIAENLFLGREPGKNGIVNRKAMRKEARLILESLGLSIHVDTLCGSLSLAEMQLVEIAKGITVDADIFILDEPTAALSAQEIVKLEKLILAMRSDKKLIFYISHKLDEIFRFCDTVTILKDGKHIATQATQSLDHEKLVSMMVGRALGQLYPERPNKPTIRNTALKIDNLVTATKKAPVSFDLMRGEILGISGLEGQGQRDILRTIFGVQPATGGTVIKFDPDTRDEFALTPSIVTNVGVGIGFIPEDRKLEGLYLPLSIKQNIDLGMFRLSSIWSRTGPVGDRVKQLMQKMNIQATGERQSVASLSGGNQQKVMIGRWLSAGVDILLVEEPTRGVDIGAKSEIYSLLRNYADEGGAVLLTSSELTEHLGFCDRILVIRDGALVADVEAAESSEDEIMHHALMGTSGNITADTEVHPT